MQSSSHKSNNAFDGQKATLKTLEASASDADEPQQLNKCDSQLDELNRIALQNGKATMRKHLLGATTFKNSHKSYEAQNRHQ